MTMELMDLFIDGFYYFYFITLFYSLLIPILPYYSLFYNYYRRYNMEVKILNFSWIAVLCW